ncbi:Serine protease inhibitor [Williamsia serinedens]|uniref:Serine protease inhibitor n=1 Tax=Williamsia serinedens TaxID=391736 RepID=A0ABT1GZG9_9NOCA|nr:Serine protease inhibitor [Williamsia serinedens]
MAGHRARGQRVRWTLRSALCLVVVGVSGCAVAQPPPDTAQLSRAPSVTFTQRGIDSVRDASVLVVDGTRRLGVALARSDGSAGRSPNVLVAPFSAMTALQTVRAGASGRAADEIDRAVGAYRPAAVAALLGQLAVVAGDPGTVDTGNPPPVPLYHQGTGVFLRTGTPPRRPYLDEVSRYVDTGVYPLAFGTEQADRALDEWTTVNTGSQQTRPPITTDRSTALAVAATAFLAGSWTQPFLPNDTVDGTFTTDSGRTVQTPIMRGSTTARLARGSGWSALELPFAGADLALQIVLPDRPGDVAAALDDGVLADVATALRQAPTGPDVAVSLPRWTTSTSTDMRPALTDLGVRSMFSGGLDAIAQDASVGSIGVSGALTIAERGTAGFADTTTTGPSTAPTTPSTGDGFTADRPFVYQVVDTSTSLPLLVGVLRDPSVS